MTFGAPRVGNRKWAEHFDAQIHEGQMKRYLIKGDPIVVLPRCLTLLCTYGHTGIQIVCHKDLELCVQDHDVPDDSSLKGMIEANLELRNHDDIHDVQGIVDHIEGYPDLYDFTLEID